MIILLNGPINSGKTTTAQRLMSQLPHMAHIEVDSLRDFIRWMPLLESLPLNLANAVAVTRNFVQHGLHVVLSYPLRQADYDYLIAQLTPLDVPIYTFTLHTTLDVLLTNRGDRELTAWERARINEMVTEGYGHPLFGAIIDNTHLNADETAARIVAMIGHDGSV